MTRLIAIITLFCGMVSNLNASLKDYHFGQSVPHEILHEIIFDETNTFAPDELVVIDRNASRPGISITVIDYVFGKYIGPASDGLHSVIIQEADGRDILYMVPTNLIGIFRSNKYVELDDLEPNSDE